MCIYIYIYIYIYRAQVGLNTLWGPPLRYVLSRNRCAARLAYNDNDNNNDDNNNYITYNNDNNSTNLLLIVILIIVIIMMIITSPGAFGPQGRSPRCQEQYPSRRRASERG